MSMKLTPAAATSTRSWPSPGSGVGRSSTASTSGPPSRWTTIVRMPPALPRQATCQRWWRCCDVAGTAEPLHGEDDTVSGVDCSVSPRCSRERVADHWLRPLHGDAVAAPNPTAVSDRSAPVSETRRPTVLYAHHDRDGGPTTKGARRQTRDEGLITHFRAAASHPHGLSVATA